ncbi:MAG: (d)CMP kinase [Bryobacter sp.]|jgi:cytidylate kinase|nr:(d)CMP kinase [Bryobacter sp. CoA8 C33]
MAFASRIIAIDGPAGAGKSTIARSLATRVNAIYIDTGAMYRAVALAALRAGIPLTDIGALERLAREVRIEFVAGQRTVLLNGEDVTAAIRCPEISSAASKVAVIQGVRAAMVDLQRRIAEHQSVVMEGRDIGSVVFPDAEVKIYLDASSETRVRRRAADLEAAGLAVDLESLRREIEERDHRDRTRASSPLVRAPGAAYIDSSDLTPAEVEAALLKVIERNSST